MKRIVYVLTAAAMMTGCSKSDENILPSETSAGRKVMIKLAEDTRTTLVYPDGDAQASKLVWCEGDKVSYFINAGDGFGSAVNAEVAADGTVAVNDAPEAAFDIKVVYPPVAEGAAYSAPKVAAAQYQPESDVFAGSNLPMEGEASVAAGVSAVDVPYKIKGSVIRLKLSATEHGSEHVRKIVLCDPSAKLAGDSETVTLTVNSMNSETLAEPHCFYIVTDCVNCNPTAKIVTDTAEYEYDGFFGAREMKPANMYRYSLNLDGGKTLRSTAVALDAAETSNCYLLSTGGEYSFTADVAGNGVDFDGNKAALLTEKDGSYGADWLWMTDSGVISDVKYSSVWKRITFTVPAGLVNGSAVIALYRNDGGAKNIVWSWHIWVNPDVKGNNYGSAEGTWLNANLGAKNCKADDAGSYGLFYQWGRKDPIIGAGVVGSVAGALENSAFAPSVTASYVANKAVFGDAAEWSVSASSVTVAEAAQSPMTHFSKVMSDENANLWLTPAPAYKKTMYDPCPAGYRVPTPTNMAKWAAVLTALGTPATTNSLATMSSVTYGRTYTVTVDGETFVDWLPAGGLRLATGIVKNVGKFGMVWNTGDINYQWCGTTEANKKVVSAGANNKQPHPVAMSVRCRKSVN